MVTSSVWRVGYREREGGGKTVARHNSLRLSNCMLTNTYVTLGRMMESLIGNSDTVSTAPSCWSQSQAQIAILEEA